MAAKLTRYLGVQPFKTSDKHIFFGRDEDIDNLLDLIMLEKLIVLFGKSGYGKSSLLSAGIVPQLTDTAQSDTFRYRPIEVRLGTYIENQSLTPFETTKRFIAELPISKGSDFLPNLQTEDSLWRQLKQRQDVENGQFVLIFDQFEELFSYPIEQQIQFKKQLAELLYTHIPQHIRAQLNDLSPAERSFMVKPLTIKAVFAIRSDRMSLLDTLKDTLPAILNKRYELRPLSTQQAKDAITKPASIVSDDFSTPPFEYTEGGLAAIVKALTTTEAKDTTAIGIEAFQLQIVCEYIESLVRDGKVPDIDGNGLPDITEAQLPEMASLYENYYRRKLAELDYGVQKAAQRVLEDGLLAEDAATGEGRRMSVDSRALLAQFSMFGLTDALLVDLEKTYLIRREMNTVGGFSFEISHDTLVAPVQKAKKDRKHIEEKALAIQVQAEKEEQLAAAKLQADIERKRRQKATVLSIISGLMFLVASVVGFWAWQQKKVAQSATEAAQAATNVAELAKNKAIKSDSLTKLALFQADASKIVALKKEEEAKNEKAKAILAALNASNSAKDTKIALDKLAVTAKSAVGIILPVIDLDILRLDYDTAFKKCQTAVKLEEPKEEMKKRILEIAYFYTETDTFQAAINTLKLLNINALPNRSDLLAVIQKNAPPQYFQTLEERYYPKMIAVAGGTFTMGSNENENEKPPHEVKVSGFKLAETETTVWQYFIFQKATQHQEPPTPTWQWKGDNPIVNVSWEDAKAYLKWLSTRQQGKYDLPTEAEWEFAARGGEALSKGYKYSGSNDIDEVAWYADNSNSQTHAVKTRKKANELGLFDMSGNVWEWCRDEYSKTFYAECLKQGIAVNPFFEKNVGIRVVRGGSWNYNYLSCRVSYRSISSPYVRDDVFGFRCIRYD